MARISWGCERLAGRRCYAARSPPLPKADFGAGRGRALHADRASPVSQPRLSIVVLPFANLGGDPEQDYFVDGVPRLRPTSIAGKVAWLTYLTGFWCYLFLGALAAGPQLPLLPWLSVLATPSAFLYRKCSFEFPLQRRLTRRRQTRDIVKFGAVSPASRYCQSSKPY
jgi:hypothetical protein